MFNLRLATELLGLSYTAQFVSASQRQFLDGVLGQVSQLYRRCGERVEAGDLCAVCEGTRTYGVAIPRSISWRAYCCKYEFRRATPQSNAVRSCPVPRSSTEKSASVTD